MCLDQAVAPTADWRLFLETDDDEEGEESEEGEEEGEEVEGEAEEDSDADLTPGVQSESEPGGGATHLPPETGSRDRS